METWIKNLVVSFGPVIVPFVFGGVFLNFLLKRLERRDQVSDRGFLSDQEVEERARFWEAAYREADAYSRWLAQLVGPTISAHVDGNYEMVEALFEVMKGSLGQKVGDKWKLNPHPDFVEKVRRNWNQVAGEQDAQPKAESKKT